MDPSWFQYDLFRKNKLPGSKKVNLIKFMLRAHPSLLIVLRAVPSGYARKHAGSINLARLPRNQWGCELASDSQYEINLYLDSLICPSFVLRPKTLPIITSIINADANDISPTILLKQSL